MIARSPSLAYQLCAFGALSHRQASPACRIRGARIECDIQSRLQPAAELLPLTLFSGAKRRRYSQIRRIADGSDSRGDAGADRRGDT
jgi:hypothetical protein